MLHTLEKVARNSGLFLSFFIKLPKVSNRNLDENSPNLVTLATGLTEKTSFEEIKRGGVEGKKVFAFKIFTGLKNLRKSCVRVLKVNVCTLTD
jgi:hypothetical protein